MTSVDAEFRTGDETGRQCSLDRLHILDTPPEPEFEKITSLVQSIFSVPVAAVSLIDRRRQWFKSIRGLEVSETTREVAFCDHTIRNSKCLNVPDALEDARFAKNPLVTGQPYIRSYLGAPIITPDGYAIGALCAIDYVPRAFGPDNEKVLASFASLIMNELELRMVASCDQLTGLATRRSFMEATDKVLDRSGEAALIFADLDRFKLINDTWGHPVGDEVLKAASAAILELCPPEAIAGRLGGEELALLLPGADETLALALAENIRTNIADRRIDAHPALSFTTSIGVAMKSDYLDRDGWMAAADAALYAAKNAGRNQVRSKSARDVSG